MKTKYIVSALTVCLSVLIGGWVWENKKSSNIIRVGVLHSLTGTMAISERHVKNATLLAIEHINRRGGIDGRHIDPVIADGRSDWPTFAVEAERLIRHEKVSAIFGCWTTASRKTIKPIIEKYNHLLFYSVQYEGLENSPNIIYTGAAPNQQIIPAVRWACEHVGRRFYLVGSEYIFPRAANEIIKAEAALLGARIVGETYLKLGATQTQHVIEQIKTTKPDVIFNTINGGTNREFFRDLSYAGITADTTAVISFSIAEKEVEVIGAKIAEGHFACWSYFQSIDTVKNRQWVRAYKAKYGASATISDAMVAAYSSVLFWAQAVKEAGTDTPKKVLQTLKGRSIDTAEGEITIDLENNHTWRHARIGRLMENGQFEIVWQSEERIRPQPYPVFRSQDQWEEFLHTYYQSWGENWEKVD
ncbi:MAG: urea ABC transporter substrate-binding protein [Desulfatitalea sp.]|nr:urea ABC transporter substrate-binding protein [Desulfatitalea sp.]NNK02310.1 urea ABC transporter substrate-binding protein [Desulfatitalea sp.]